LVPLGSAYTGAHSCSGTPFAEVAVRNIAW
jgi:hypothetical protein